MEPNEINETICAISTPPGRGGIAVVRVSGPDAVEVVSKIWQGKNLQSMSSHTVHLGNITDREGELLDQVVLTIYRAPRSFTGQDVVEISVHGSRWIQRQVIDTLCHSGARLAQPGEFTRRAFASGRLDLSQAEAVADMIDADSRAAHRAAATQMRGHYSARLASLRDQLIELASLLELELDFGEEQVEFASRTRLVEIATTLHQQVTALYRSFSTGSVIKEGIPVAIVGPTNAGKSSLLNAILGDERAIVSDIHGTTRDIIEDVVEIGDYRFRLLDTAGLRDTTDVIEQRGIDLAHKAIRRAHIIIYTIDASDPQAAIEQLTKWIPTTNDAHTIVALNKSDLVTGADLNALRQQVENLMSAADSVMAITTLDINDIERIKEQLTSIMDHETTNTESDIIVTNARHAQALEQAAQSIQRVIEGLTSGLSADFIAQDTRQTIHHLSTITGAITTDDLLATIFHRFCIGK